MITKVNVVNPKTKKRQLGALNPVTGTVKLIHGLIYSIKYLTKVAGSDGIGYFETFDDYGNVIQKKGKPK